MDFRSFPKIELHLHLDCSISFRAAQTLLPTLSQEEFQNTFKAPPRCENLPEYLGYATREIELMQTQEQLEIVTSDLIRQLRKDNVIYSEIRFAPLLHTAKGLSPEQVVEAVVHTIEKETSDEELEVNLLLCTLRHFSREMSNATVELVENFKGRQVVGLDIAGDEKGYPLDNHIEAFAYARDHGIKCTAHAGEACGPESIHRALEKLHPQRLGHGIRSIEDPSLLKRLKEENIHLEICPSSNIQTSVYPGYNDHPVDQLLNAGLSIGINTDGRTIADINLASEYEKLNSTFGWGMKEFLDCNLDALDASFTDESRKGLMRKKLIEAYGWNPSS